MSLCFIRSRKLLMKINDIIEKAPTIINDWGFCQSNQENKNYLIKVIARVLT